MNLDMAYKVAMLHGTARPIFSTSLLSNYRSYFYFLLGPYGPACLQAFPPEIQVVMEFQ